MIAMNRKSGDLHASEDSPEPAAERRQSCSPTSASAEPGGHECEALACVPGCGSWLVLHYAPVALFSLKFSGATSSVGLSLLVPTPYAIKMALVDACFRAGFPDAACAEFLRDLVTVDTRISPPSTAVVTHTFVRVRQEPKTRDSRRPYISSIAYREMVYHQGRWQWALDLRGHDAVFVERLLVAAPSVRYIGKRGSFVQFLGFTRIPSVDGSFTQPLTGAEALPRSAHIAVLDDFGPDADLETLSSFSAAAAKRDKHRRFVRTLVPLGLTNTGPRFSEYRAQQAPR